MGKIHNHLCAYLGADPVGALSSFADAVDIELEERDKKIAKLENTLQLLTDLLGLTDSLATLQTLIKEMKSAETYEQVQTSVKVIDGTLREIMETLKR